MRTTYLNSHYNPVDHGMAQQINVPKTHWFVFKLGHVGVGNVSVVTAGIFSNKS